MFLVEEGSVVLMSPESRPQVDERSKTNVLDTIIPRWILNTCNVFGLLPVRNEGGLMMFDYKAAVWSLIVLGVVGTWVVSVMAVNPPGSSISTNKVQQVIGSLHLICCVVGSAVIVCLTALKCKYNKFDGIIKNMIIFEEFCTVKGISHEQISPSHVEDVLSAAMIIYLFLVDMPFRAYFFWLEFHELIKSLVIPFFTFTMYFVLFEILLVRIAVSLTERFRRLNMIVQQCFGQSMRTRFQISVIFVLPADAPKVTVEEIEEMHRLLCRTIEEINSNFASHMVFLFIFHFTNTVGNPYLFLQACVGSLTIKYSFAFIISQLFITSYWFFTFVFITWTASQTTYHAKRTAYYLSSVLSLDLSTNDRKEVKYSLAQICNNKTDFTLMNLINIDMPLITAFVGCAVSHVVLILQIEGSSHAARPQ